MAVYIDGVKVAGFGGRQGQGVPIGGTAGQVLAKKSGANYDTEWVNQSASGGSGTMGHDDLTNRDIADQHPIVAITNLQDELDKRIALDGNVTATVDAVFGGPPYTIEFTDDPASVAGNVNYDNSQSGMSATTMQEAIDELHTAIGSSSSGSTSGVTSFNGRNGTVMPQADDYSASIISYNNSTTQMSATTTQGAIDELFQSVSNGKSLVASAITDKGVTTAADATFQTMADNIGNIVSTSNDLVLKHIQDYDSISGTNVVVDGTITYMGVDGIKFNVTQNMIEIYVPEVTKIIFGSIYLNGINEGLNFCFADIGNSSCVGHGALLSNASTYNYIFRWSIDAEYYISDGLKRFRLVVSSGTYLSDYSIVVGGCSIWYNAE